MDFDSPTRSLRVAQAFDSVAAVFEQSLENSVTRRLRRKLYEKVRTLKPPPSSVLDINCGVGIDAVALAEEGYSVVGVDISPKMVNEAQNRARHLRVDGVSFAVASFEELTVGINKPFDLLISNFGGLNCLANLERTANQVATLTKPGGHFVAVVMPQVSVWEILAGLARLDFRSAFRRFHSGPLATGFRGESFVVSYHSPRSLISFFRPWFDVLRIEGWNIISPPPQSRRFIRTFSRLSRLLEHIEDRISGWPILRSTGDHYLIVFERRRHGTA